MTNKTNTSYQGLSFKLFAALANAPVGGELKREDVPLKNVTPKKPVQLELPFEEFKNEK